MEAVAVGDCPESPTVDVVASIPCHVELAVGVMLSSMDEDDDSWHCTTAVLHEHTRTTINFHSTIVEAIFKH